ncbi:hypothetical protein HYC85_022241 [Camellia sinensis]|uniref:Uncharacterized protein n=1 Tax=Camellia sinensis TaxID=4442 RepID=A0A7J7GNS0_CAMSI|nr:hypothetical protein HYC85_022241 [Camellia sinensis]
MAYRRRQLGITRASTFKEEIHYPPADDETKSSSSSSSSSSLAAQAIRASAAHRDSSSLSSAYGDSVFHSSFRERPKDSSAYYTSLKGSNKSKGFWGVLAEKAKAILEDDDAIQQFESPRTRLQTLNTSTGGQWSYDLASLSDIFIPWPSCFSDYQPYQSFESSRKVDNPRFQKGLDALTNSLNQIGDSIGNALEEGRTIVETKTADIMNETRKLQISRRGGGFEEQNQVSGGAYNPWHQQLSVQFTQPQMQTNQQSQLKASRDVAMATAAKAKLLLRELKTVKADLAFAKERSAQLEEENGILREACEKGDNPADDEMMECRQWQSHIGSVRGTLRLQLETLLAEKARLAHENSVYSRENRLLREIVEYHQLTMQDVVYLDEGIEEVTEVYPIPAISRMLSVSPPSPSSPCSPKIAPSTNLPSKKETIPQAKTDIPRSEASLSSSTSSAAQDSMRRSNASS